MSKWEWKKLGEVCDSINGLWKGKKEPFIKVGVIRNTNFTKNCKLDLNPSKLEFLDVEKKQYDKRKLQFGDLIVEKSGGSEKQPVGRVVLFEEKEGEYSFSNFTSVLRIKNDDEIECHFLHLQLYKLYLDGVTKQMQSATTGIHNLDFDQFKDLSIGIPPLSEQKRIVKFLDEEFSKIDTLKTNAETNLKNAKELFETTLEKELNPLSRHSERSEESSADLPSGWEWKTLRELCILRPSKNEALSHLKGTDEVSFLPMEDLNIRERNTIPHKSRALSEVHGSYTFFAEGDVLLAKVTPCFENGKMGIASNLLNGVGFGSSEYIVFRTTKSMINSYLFYVLMSSRFISGGKKQMLGACGLKRLSKEYVESFQIPLPPLSVQKEIVARLDKLSENVKRLEANYKQTIANCDELKKTILKQTFQGGN